MGNRNGKMALSLLTGAFVGAAIGAGVGILFAPHKGSKTRRKIRHTAVGTAYDFSKWLKHSKDELTKSAHDNKEAFEEKLEGALSAMNHKAEDVISSLEDKLENIKKKNAEYQK